MHGSKQSVSHKTNLSQTVSLKARVFSDSLLQKAVNTLAYGIKMKAYFKGSKKGSETAIFVSDEDLTCLQILNKKKSYSRYMIPFKDISILSENPTYKMPKELDGSPLLFINTNKDDHILMNFKSPEERDLGSTHLFRGLSSLIMRMFALAGNPQQTVNAEDLQTILGKIGISISLKELTQKFHEFDENKDGTMDKSEFVVFIKWLFERTELLPIFKSFCPSVDTSKKGWQCVRFMTYEQLRSFIETVQGEEFISFDNIKAVVEPSEREELKTEIVFEPEKLSFITFASIVYSNFNSVFDPSKEKLYQDMDRPLSDYYINSSHNTYLMGDQLTGKSSVQAYINAFQKGCRCVELDCWDGDKGEPIVYHGHTLTSKIFFEDIIIAIREHGFLNSEFPIILSLEMHCGFKQQGRIAEIMRKEFGEMLYTIPEGFMEYDKYPSPNQLRGKIIVKGKGSLEAFLNPVDKLKYHLQEDNESNRFVTMCERAHLYNFVTVCPMIDFVPREYDWNGQNYGKNFAGEEALSEEEEEVDDDEIVEGENKKKKKKKVKSNIELTKTLTMLGKKFGLNDDKSRTVWNISSISENKLNKIYASHPLELIKFHRRYFTRVYPKGLRFDSSNYDPMKGFITGSQIIALNFQTHDHFLLTYLSKFQENGGINSGYLLKPEYLRYDTLEEKNPRNFVHTQKIFLITLMSGYQIPTQKSADISPFVEVELRGNEVDESRNKVYNSQTANNNCYNPDFKNLECQFTICDLDNAILTFAVFDAISNKMIAFYGISAKCLRKGLRVCPLRSTVDGKFQLNSFLLIKVEIKTPAQVI